MVGYPQDPTDGGAQNCYILGTSTYNFGAVAVGRQEPMAVKMDHLRMTLFILEWVDKEEAVDIDQRQAEWPLATVAGVDIQVAAGVVAVNKTIKFRRIISWGQRWGWSRWNDFNH